jgi:hypothetical protein
MGRSVWRRLLLVLVLVVFIWGITVINVTFIYTTNHPNKESTVLKVGMCVRCESVGCVQ